MALLALLHTPPGVISLNVTVLAWLTLLTPEIAATAGTPSTVTTVVIIQVFVPVYVTVAVPSDTPYTRPLPLTVAVPTGLIVHDVPAVASDRNVTAAMPHTTGLPSIAVGRLFTVIVLVFAQPLPARV